MPKSPKGSTEPPVRELIRTYADSVAALRARGVIRSTKVVADYGEWLAARALNLVLVTGGAQKGHDAEDPRTGATYQVKVRQVMPPYMQPDLRGQGALTGRPFDFLVGILIDGDYRVARAAVVPLSVVQARAKRIAYNNGFRLHMASGLLSLPEVRDVTAEVRRAAEE